MNRRSALGAAIGLGAIGAGRRWTSALLGGAAAGTSAAAPPVSDVEFPAVIASRRLVFPADHGAHPAYRTEWWYVTGQVGAPGLATPLGFQVTFFRVRLPHENPNPSAFSARQLVIAHAGIADVRQGRLLHDQKIARSGFGLAGTDQTTTRVYVDDWRLELAQGRYTATIPGRDFRLQLRFQPDGPPMLQGDQGFSRKGPRPAQASYYYSRPQLATSGTIAAAGQQFAVEGRAWLDHEWSSEIMDEHATGWDWIGINLDDGAALMAFRMRGRDGEARWAAASLREQGKVMTFGPREVAFEPLRHWRSARTGAQYPVSMQVRTGTYDWTIVPLMDDQELDSRITTGAVYWEGAVQVRREGRTVGSGYLEMTGYVEPIRF